MLPIDCDLYEAANVLHLRPRRFDRILSAKMLEHMRNYDALLSRISSWLEPGGRFLPRLHAPRARVPVRRRLDGVALLHRRDDAIGRPPPRLARDLSLVRQWRVGGEHYARTSEAWLERMAENREEIVDVLGSRAAYNEWRVFFLACAELWGYRGGTEWQISHYLFA